MIRKFDIFFKAGIFYAVLSSVNQDQIMVIPLYNPDKLVFFPSSEAKNCIRTCTKDERVALTLAAEKILE